MATKLGNTSLKFKLITPEGLVLEDEVVKVKVKTSEGGITILPNHAELKSNIVPSTAKIYFADANKEDQKFSIADGLMEVHPNAITIIASSAKPKEADDPFDV